MERRRISTNFTARLEGLQTSAMGLDNEQEDFKMADIDKMMSEAKKAVKLEMEMEAWKSFGIQDAG